MVTTPFPCILQLTPYFRITIFDDIQDDFYDGDFLEADEDFPRANLKFKMHCEPTLNKSQIHLNEDVHEEEFVEKIEVHEEVERDEHIISGRDLRRS